MSTFLTFTHQHPFLTGSALILLWVSTLAFIAWIIDYVLNDETGSLLLSTIINWVLFNFIIYFLFSESTCPEAIESTGISFPFYIANLIAFFVLGANIVGDHDDD